MKEPAQNPSPHPNEGTLYKRVTLFGKTFELSYGYYEEKDRSGAPDVLYPDFLATPSFTEEGIPFATMMQDACPHFCGKGARTEDSTCGECTHFVRAEEWFGVCTCRANRQTTDLNIINNEKEWRKL